MNYNIYLFLNKNTKWIILYSHNDYNIMYELLTGFIKRYKRHLIGDVVGNDILFILTDEIYASNDNLLTYPEGIIITPKQRTHWSHYNFLLIHQYYNKSGHLTCYGHYTDYNNNIISELCITKSNMFNEEQIIKNYNILDNI